MGPFAKIFFISFTLIILKTCTISGDTIGEYLCENQPPNTKLQHPEHCDVYLICDNNRAIEMKCPSGIMFNPRTNECDPQFKNCPANAGHRGDGSDYDEDDDEDDNDDEGEGEEDEEEEPNEEEPDNEDDEAEEKVEENDDEDDESPAVVKPPKQNPPAASETSGCPKVDTDQITFLMHKTDCSLYFLCYHGKPIPFQCSMGMHWSNEQKKCVPKEVSECGAISHGSEGGCPQRGIKFMPHPNACQNFIFCLNGAETIQRCEPFYHWDVNEGKCKLKTMATCYRNLRQAIDTKKLKSGLRNNDKKYIL